MTTPQDPIAAAKAALREVVLARRDALSAIDRAALSARISARVLALPSYRAAKTVLAYMAFGSEFDTTAIVNDALAQGKTLLLPRVERSTRRLVLHRVTDLARDLQPGTWGILEPRADLTQLTQVIDLKWVMVPGVAFTQHGARLGYGAGFYDKWIARCVKKPALVAAAFATQVVETVPCTATDRCVDQVVTEDTIYVCSKCPR